MFVWGSFYVGVYKHARPGSISNRIIVFKVTRGASYEIQGIIEAIAADSQQDPIFLSRRVNSEYVASI